jgi:hypothetical protein
MNDWIGEQSPPFAAVVFDRLSTNAFSQAACTRATPDTGSCAGPEQTTGGFCQEAEPLVPLPTGAKEPGSVAGLTPPPQAMSATSKPASGRLSARRTRDTPKAMASHAPLAASRQTPRMKFDTFTVANGRRRG